MEHSFGSARVRGVESVQLYQWVQGLGMPESMNHPDDTGETTPYTPGWKDKHGIVHIAGTHTYGRVFAECGTTISEGGRQGRSWPEYEQSLETPTCIMCIGSVVDHLPGAAYQDVGDGIINTAVISKLKLGDDE